MCLSYVYDRLHRVIDTLTHTPTQDTQQGPTHWRKHHG